MSDLGNKEVMAKNLKHYIAQSGKDRRELSKIWGFPYSTITEWINGKKYPRIDRIEIMADYFGILKSDLIEDKSKEHYEMQKNNDTITDAVVKMRTNEDFLSVVKKLTELDDEQIKGVSQMLNAFIK